MRLYIGLLHYPVYNKNHVKIASALTNLDLHDLSRLAKTYGAKRFFVITPLVDQQELAGRILEHWTVGYGASYNTHRKEAIELIEIRSSLEEAVGEIEEVEADRPILIATDASARVEKPLAFPSAINILQSGKTIFILFGTAWGLHREVIEKVDFLLEPIWGNTDYNHLSVRTAAAIILDRPAGRDL
jgi:tRNA (guanine37-N1)-methyltransferase